MIVFLLQPVIYIQAIIITLILSKQVIYIVAILIEILLQQMNYQQH